MEPDVRERFERLEGIVASLVEVARSHDERLDRITNTVERLTLIVDRVSTAQEQTQEELSTLIRMMDEWIRRNPPPS